MSVQCKPLGALGSAGLVTTLLVLAGCAVPPPMDPQAEALGDAPTMRVTGSRIPHKVPGGKSDAVKTTSREGFAEDMRANQMPHRVGN